MAAISPLTDGQILGLEQDHLVCLSDNHQLTPAACAGFGSLRKAAAAAGFDLRPVSCYRSLQRQAAIWNAKACGQRPVHDDAGEPLVLSGLSAAEQLAALLRFSALPGTSRHHWGTDLDIYDAAAVPEDYKVRLEPDEVTDAGVFGPLHQWLDEQMAAGQSFGFYRPYGVDRGGVAPERWHLSFAPQAIACEQRVSAAGLRAAWDALPEPLALRAAIEPMLPELLRRYVMLPEDWCPAPS